MMGGEAFRPLLFLLLFLVSPGVRADSLSVAIQTTLGNDTLELQLWDPLFSFLNASLAPYQLSFAPPVPVGTGARSWYYFDILVASPVFQVRGMLNCPFNHRRISPQ